MRQRIAILTAAAAAMFAVACGQSDPGITTAVKAKLAQDDTVKAYQIDVDTSDRVVTLSGAVETMTAKEQAVTLARQTEGVRDVVDRLRVDPQAAATTGREAGEEIREEAREAQDAAREAVRRAGDAAERGQAVVSDAAVTTAIKSKLLADTTVAGLKIDVDTQGGVVSLNGTANTRAEADRAVTLARNTDGVSRVVDNIRVGR